MGALISEKVACARSGRIVLQDLSFSADFGSLLAIEGPNGSGKSTLLRVLCGLLSPSSGRIFFHLPSSHSHWAEWGAFEEFRKLMRSFCINADTEGTSCPAPSSLLQSISHYSGHQDGLRASWTVSENLIFWNKLYTGGQSSLLSACVQKGSFPETGSLETVLQRLDLSFSAEIPVSCLSAGQRRRLSFARLLLTPRPLWLLDEPEASLDRKGKELLTGLMQAQLDKGGLIFVATHSRFAVSPQERVQLVPEGRRSRSNAQCSLSS